jgi:hypothetical protein
MRGVLAECCHSETPLRIRGTGVGLSGLCCGHASTGSWVLPRVASRDRSIRARRPEVGMKLMCADQQLGAAPAAGR